MATTDKEQGAMDPASQCVIATAKLVRSLNDSSACERLENLPKELSAKLPNIRNTGILLHQMPSMVISLDSHLDKALQSASKLVQVKSDIEDSTQKTGIPIGTVGNLNPALVTEAKEKVSVVTLAYPRDS